MARKFSRLSRNIEFIDESEREKLGLTDEVRCGYGGMREYKLSDMNIRITNSSPAEKPCIIISDWRSSSGLVKEIDRLTKGKRISVFRRPKHVSEKKLRDLIGGSHIREKEITSDLIHIYDSTFTHETFVCLENEAELEHIVKELIKSRASVIQNDDEVEVLEENEGKSFCITTSLLSANISDDEISKAVEKLNSINSVSIFDAALEIEVSRIGNEPVLEFDSKTHNQFICTDDANDFEKVLEIMKEFEFRKELIYSERNHESSAKQLRKILDK